MSNTIRIILMSIIIGAGIGACLMQLFILVGR